MANSFSFAVAIALLGTTGIIDWSSSAQAQGSLFTAAPVEQSRFIVVRAPIGNGERSQLNIYEQRSNKGACFAVEGSSPAVVDPLLAKFDFTGICNRYIDGNGYSLRIGGDDLGTRYRLNVVKTNEDVHLLAIPTRDTSNPTLVVARARGAVVSDNDFLKLVFEPGWQLMRRQYGQRTLGHIYVFSETWPDNSEKVAEDTSTEGLSTENSSSEATSSEDTSSEDTSTEGLSTENSSSEDTSSEDSSAEATSSED